MANPNFVPSFSSDEIWRGQDTNRCISDDLDTIESNIDSIKSDIKNLGSSYAAVNHIHNEYAAKADVNAVRDALGTKSDVSHKHDDYAPLAHVHNEYAPLNHAHDDYATKAYVSLLSDKVSTKVDLDYIVNNYATLGDVEAVASIANDKAQIVHYHDDLYYTEEEVDSMLRVKSDKNHYHVVDSSLSETSLNPVQNKVVNSALSEKVPVSRTVNGKPLASNISLTASDVGADADGAAANAITSAKAYTDSKIDALVGNGASTTLDTIGEISAAIESNQDAVKAINAAIGTKANASELTSHTSDTDSHITSAERAKWNAAKTHADLAHAPSDAEPNQNAFSNILVNDMTTICADTKTDTLNLVGSNITITPDTVNDKLTIGIDKSNVTAALGYTPPAKDTTYTVATQTLNGLMSSSDKKKLDNIPENVNNYVLPSAGSALGGVKTGGDVTISNGIITVNDDSHSHDKSYVSKNLQFTADNGDVEVSLSGQDVVAKIKAMSTGVHTAYAKSGTTNNPKKTESWRFMIHKTGSANFGWVMAFGSVGSIYTGYLDNGVWRGWKCLFDNDPEPLWSGASYMHSPNSTPQVVKPSKKLSECQHGWLLLWSDYDPGKGTGDIDFATTMIPKNNPAGGKWGGKAFLCDVPRYAGSDPNSTATEKRIIKVLYVHDDCIKGSFQNASDDRNDVCLRAVFEY